MTRASKPPTSGKGTLKLLLTNLTIPFGGITMIQVLSTDALIRYTWESPTPATEDEPPDYGSFDIVSIRLQAEMRLADDRSKANVKLWKNTEMIDVLSDEQIDAFEIHCEMLLRSPESVKYAVDNRYTTAHKTYWYDTCTDEALLKKRGYAVKKEK